MLQGNANTKEYFRCFCWSVPQVRRPPGIEVIFKEAADCHRKVGQKTPQIGKTYRKDATNSFLLQFFVVTYSGSHLFWRMHAEHILVSHRWLFAPSPNTYHHTLGFSCPHSLDLLKAWVWDLLLFWRDSHPADGCKEALGWSPKGSKN